MTQSIVKWFGIFSMILSTSGAVAVFADSSTTIPTVSSSSNDKSTARAEAVGWGRSRGCTRN